MTDLTGKLIHDICRELSSECVFLNLKSSVSVEKNNRKINF